MEFSEEIAIFYGIEFNGMLTEGLVKSESESPATVTSTKGFARYGIDISEGPPLMFEMKMSARTLEENQKLWKRLTSSALTDESLKPLDPLSTCLPPVEPSEQPEDSHGLDMENTPFHSEGVWDESDNKEVGSTGSYVLYGFKVRHARCYSVLLERPSSLLLLQCWDFKPFNSDVEACDIEIPSARLLFSYTNTWMDW